jgi:hypothetical protein
MANCEFEYIVSVESCPAPGRGFHAYHKCPMLTRIPMKTLAFFRWPLPVLGMASGLRLRPDYRRDCSILGLNARLR